MSIQKAIPGNAYHEGYAVSFNPGEGASPSVSNGYIPPDDWAVFLASVDGRYRNSNYYNTYPASISSTGDVSPAVSTNSQAIVTYLANLYGSHVINGVAWSYDATPATGVLTVEDGSGNIVFNTSITSSGPGFFEFEENGKKGTRNTDMIVRLGAGGSGVTGKISVLGHRLE